MAPITFPKAGKASETSGVKSVEELKADVLNRINQIHATEQEQSAYLSSDDIAELQKMETLLQGSLALLEQFEKTGGMMPATTAVDTADGPQLSSVNMKTGWNGGFQSDTTDPNCEVISPFNQGTDVKNGLVFKMDDSMASVKGKNIGTDIEFTVTYKDKTIPNKKYLVKGMVTNPTSLIIAGDQTTGGVTVDLSHVKRIGGSILILGGSGNDTLIGSQGDDQIFGNGGDDTISGLGGINKLYGGAGTDEFYSVNKYDTIDGGEGYDTIHVVDKDVAKAAKFTEETVETETTPVDKDANFTGTGWKAEADDVKGELTITKASDAKDGGTINLKVPDGVMVYSKADGDDLILTYQTLTEDGLPGETQVVRIKGVLNSKSSAKITITGESTKDSPSVIDFGGVNTYFNQITLKKGEGDDVIIAPKTAFAGYGITAENIGKGSFDSETTNKIHTNMEKDKSTHWVEFDNGVSTKPFPGWKTPPKVEKGEITLYPPDGQEVMDLKEPKLDGYHLESSVAENKTDEITLTLFMKKDGGDAVERLVIHIKKTGGNPKTVTVGGYTPQNKDVLTKLIANENDTGGGIFVASESSVDKSKAGKNTFIDK